MSLRRIVPLLALVAAPLAAGCAAAPARPADAAVPVAQEGFLQPGDVVKLAIWREDDLSGEYPVDTRGVVVFPKLGEYTVGSETAESLRERLVRDFDRYLINPSIQVSVTRSIRILGAVYRPGRYEVEPTTTLADALADAGGPAPHGRDDRIELVRDGRRILVDVHAGDRLMELPVRSGDEIHIPMRSWAARNVGTIVTGVSALVGVIIAVAVR